jgi:hypothetical protein
MGPFNPGVLKTSLAIEARFHIASFAERHSTSPYRLELRSEDGTRHGDVPVSTAEVDEETLRAWGIDPGKRLAGRVLRVGFTSRTMPRRGDRGHETGLLSGDFLDTGSVDRRTGLFVLSVEKHEKTTVSLCSAPPFRTTTTARLLVLGTPQPGGTLYRVPCPDYRFHVLLDEAQYASCLALPDAAYFVVAATLEDPAAGAGAQREVP